jgi:hypothetical protein
MVITVNTAATAASSETYHLETTKPSMPLTVWDERDQQRRGWRTIDLRPHSIST